MNRDKRRINASAIMVFKTEPGDSAWDLSCESASRFIEATSVLSNNGFIGWQLSGANGESLVPIVFADADSCITEKDYCWIFKDCAIHTEENMTTSDIFPVKKRRLYTLIASNTKRRAVHFTGNYGFIIFEDRVNNGDPAIKEPNVPELLDMLIQEKGIIHIKLLSTDERGKDSGKVYFSFPGEISFRLQTMILKTLTGYEVQEVQFLEEDNSPCLGDKFIAEFLACMLNTLRKTGSVNSLSQIEIADESASDESTDYQRQLDELVGLDEVKNQVKKIVAFAKMRKEMTESGINNLDASFNMEFVGNPGTAKTTVARILSGIFYEIGLLPELEMIEAGRADLVAKYEGQTANKVKELFNKARGKVLFIDEAYSLVENWDGSYGDEAINTIVQEMENNRKDTIVIFAGYPDKMKEFFDRNPGLKSRVPFCLNFEDYSVDEMLKIVELEVAKRGFRMSNASKSKVLLLCSEAKKVSDTGNGRFCRNLVERAIINYAYRVYGTNSKVSGKKYILRTVDFCMPNSPKSPTKNKIGFII